MIGQTYRAVLLVIGIFTATSMPTVISSYEECGSSLVACDNGLSGEAKALGGDPHEADIRLGRSFPRKSAFIVVR